STRPPSPSVPFQGASGAPGSMPGPPRKAAPHGSPCPPVPPPLEPIVGGRHWIEGESLSLSKRSIDLNGSDSDQASDVPAASGLGLPVPLGVGAGAQPLAVRSHRELGEARSWHSRPFRLAYRGSWRHRRPSVTSMASKAS